MKINFIKNNNFRENGFTLVETLIAIGIFSISVVALMGALSSGISNTGYAKQKLIASYLAQEGIERVRNIRDTYSLDSTNGGWPAFYTQLTSMPQMEYGYFVDNTTLYFSACQIKIHCPKLRYDNSTHEYGYTRGDISGFERRIEVSPIYDNSQRNVDKLKITSTVLWEQGNSRQSISFSEVLFNWIE